jgi:hypothetical protein
VHWDFRIIEHRISGYTMSIFTSRDVSRVAGQDDDEIDFFRRLDCDDSTSN